MRPYYVRAGSGLTNNSALGKRVHPQAQGWLSALRPVPVRFICGVLLRETAEAGLPARARRRRVSEIGLAGCKALELPARASLGLKTPRARRIYAIRRPGPPIAALRLLATQILHGG